MTRRLLVVLVTLAAALTLAAPSPAPAATAPPRAEAPNPLAGREWGVYGGSGELEWAPYVKSTGWMKKLLAKIALRPRA